MAEETPTVDRATVDSMFKVGAHFAYSKSRRHPSMSDYMFGVKNKVEIFDLEKTSGLFQTTKDFMKECGKHRKVVLFVGGKNEARDIIKAAAAKLDMPYVAGRWIGGTLTNFSEIKKRLTRLNDLQTQKEKGEFTKYTKLEQLHLDREIEKLEAQFGGIRHMTKLPDLLFVIDTKHEDTAVGEAKRRRIPIVGLLNSDCDVRDADQYFIGNDASIASITFFVDEAVRAYEDGLAKAPVPTQDVSDAGA